MHEFIRTGPGHARSLDLIMTNHCQFIFKLNKFSKYLKDIASGNLLSFSYVLGKGAVKESKGREHLALLKGLPFWPTMCKFILALNFLDIGFGISGAERF